MMELDQKIIQQKYGKRFSHLSRKRSIANCFSIIFLHVGSAIIFTSSALYLWQFDKFYGAIASVFAFLFVGTRFRALANILHECTHNGFAPYYRLNSIFSHIICVVLFYSLDSYKKHHRTHHAFTGDYEKDLEFGPIQHFLLHKDFNRTRLFEHIHRLVTLQYIGHYIGGVALDLKEDKFWLILRSLYILTIVFSSIYFGLGSYQSIGLMLFLIAPVFTIVPTITYIMDIIDHGGLLGNENMAERARNYTTKSTLLNFLIFPHHDSYHLVHHMFPSMPTRDLHTCHEILLEEEPSYSALTHTLKGLIQVSTRLQSSTATDTA